MPHPNTLRVVAKSKYDDQIFIEIPELPDPPAPSSIRIRSLAIALNSNNLSYCAAGTLLHWWDTFPVPLIASEILDDISSFGVAPGWGYGVVEQSTIPSLPTQTVVYGFLPVSAHATDLRLQQSDVLSNHWIEISPHRSQVMSLYHRYITYPPGTINLDGMLSEDPNVKFTPILRPVWEAGFLLANHVFPPYSENSKPIHPFGIEVSPWTSSQADLTNGLIINIAAGTKTSRSFLEQLSLRKTAVPAAVIEVTSGSGCDEYLSNLPFKQKTIRYDAISTSQSFELYTDSSIRKIVILDFGGRHGAITRVLDSVKEAYPDTPVICVAIGSEAKVATTADRQARQERIAKTQSIQMNASGIRQEAIKRYGERKYFEDLGHSFESVVETQTAKSDGVLGVRAIIKHGSRGEDGLEGVWTRLCAGKVRGEEGILVNFRA